ncbi:hypothetical protein [Streptomyces sp. SYSU K21746]
MHEATFQAELERRLALLEDPASGESALPDLPWRDVWIAALGLIAVALPLVWWGYPA